MNIIKMTVFKKSEKSNSKVGYEKRIDILNLIPITTHYNSYTLLDKNSNLIQTIKINGFDHNDNDLQKHELRDLVRQSIVQNIQSDEYSIYFHTIRERTDIRAEAIEPFGFVKDLADKWCRKHNWDKQLNNTLYITVVIKGPNFGLFNLQYLFPRVFKKNFIAKLAELEAKLSHTTEAIIKDLSRFGSRKLTIIDTEEKTISEPLSFFYYLIHLKQKEIEISIRNFAEQASSLEKKYHFNMMEFHNNNETRYASIFTIKETPNNISQALDPLIQCGSQFIICEVMRIAKRTEALKALHSSIDIIKTNPEPEALLQDTGLKEIEDCKALERSGYCAYQISIVVYSDDINFFTQKNRMIIEHLNNIGIIAIREDFFMAQCFWNIIPGNMRFLQRIRYGSLSRVGAFSNIHHHNLGCYNGSIWGGPITIFRHIDGNPFYFNFHCDHNGNTVIVGPKDAGKTTLMRFLLAQSFKLSPKILYIDFEGGSNQLIKQFGGFNIEVDNDGIPPLQVAPFDLDCLENYRDFIKHWLSLALDISITEDHIETIINKIKEIQKSDDTYELQAFKDIIEEIWGESISTKSNLIINSESMENFFSQTVLDVLELETIINLDVHKIKNPILLELYIAMLIAKIPETLDDTPTIIALSCGDTLLNMPSLRSILVDFFKKVAQKNAIIIFTKNQDHNLEINNIIKEILDYIPTQFFLSDRYIDRALRSVYNLSEHDMNHIKSYDPDRHMFLLKQKNFQIVSNYDLSAFPDIMEILCALD